MSTNSTVIGLFGEAISRWRTHRAEAHTRRVIEGLPRSIRKDIGWPETLSDGRRTSGWSL